MFGKNQTMSWSLEENLPRRRKDTEFDKLVQTLHLPEKRWYISQRWLYFKKARGIVPPPVYKYENVNELISAVEKSIDEATVVLASIKTTQNWAGFRRIGC